MASSENSGDDSAPVPPAEVRPQPKAAAQQNLELRPMLTDDLPSVLQNERRSYQFPWTPGVFADCLRASHECRVLVRDGVILGHAIASVAAGESHLLNLCMRRDEQGQGLGKILLNDVIERIRQRQATMVFLEVRPSNLPAIALYDAAGFREIGVRKDYYPAPVGYEDALIMGLDFSLESLFSDNSDAD